VEYVDRRGLLDLHCCFLVHNRHIHTLSRTQAPTMTDISQLLPPELLTEILERVSVSDVLRFKQVRGPIDLTARVC
jgi:hypothetical protein